jgi:hypothetical protein
MKLAYRLRQAYLLLIGLGLVAGVIVAVVG